MTRQAKLKISGFSGSLQESWKTLTLPYTKKKVLHVLAMRYRFEKRKSHRKFFFVLHAIRFFHPIEPVYGTQENDLVPTYLNLHI